MVCLLSAAPRDVLHEAAQSMAAAAALDVRARSDTTAARHVAVFSGHAGSQASSLMCWTLARRYYIQVEVASTIRRATSLLACCLPACVSAGSASVLGFAAVVDVSTIQAQ